MKKNFIKNQEELIQVITNYHKLVDYIDDFLNLKGDSMIVDLNINLSKLTISVCYKMIIDDSYKFKTVKILELCKYIKEHDKS